jgi:hypothetical protein
MIGTSFISPRDETENCKTFKKFDHTSLGYNKIILSQDQAKNQKSEINFSTWFRNAYVSFSNGALELIDKNYIYCLEYMPESKDIILPKNPFPMDWVVLYYDLMNGVDLSSQRVAKLNIYGNGKRIMGFDEPLKCDMQFLSLKLTFVEEQSGWVVT